MTKSITIIGAGFAGLACGCYAQINGFKSTIIENQSNSGGLACEWQRNGHSINMNAFPYILGMTEEFYEYNRLWKTVGVMPDVKFDLINTYMKIVDINSDKNINFSKKIDDFEKELLDISPEDNLLIKKIVCDIRKLSKYPKIVLPSRDKMTFSKYLELILKNGIGIFLLLTRLQKQSLADLSNRFKSPFLKDAFKRIFADPEDTVILVPLSMMAYGNSFGTPVGGNSAIFEAIEKRYLELGGNIIYNNKIIDARIEGKSIKSLISEKGNKIDSDYYVWTGDLFFLLNDVLKGKYPVKEINRVFKITKPASSCIMIHIQPNSNFKIDYPENLIWTSTPLIEPIQIADEKHLFFQYSVKRIQNRQNSNQTVINAYLVSKFESWLGYTRGSSEYIEKKEKIKSVITESLDKIYPDLKKSIEYAEAATPLTWHKYTMNWKGSAHGFCYNPQLAKMTGGLRQKFDKLTNLYMAGEWINPPAGVFTAAYSGKSSIELICEKEKIKFKE